jgi:addiction module HigA family antidote
MSMANPPHPGDLIRAEVLAPFDLSVSAAAEVLGVRRATQSDLLNEKSALTPEMALRIEKFFPTTEHLLRMQLAFDIAQMRRRSDEIGVLRFKPEGALN